MEWVEVPDVVEAIHSVTFELDGQPVYLNGPTADKPGDMFHRDNVIVRARPDLFAPARFPLGSVQDRTTSKLNSAWRADPAQDRVTEMLNRQWQADDAARAARGS